jgi:hypothetical protein
MKNIVKKRKWQISKYHSQLDVDLLINQVYNSISLPSKKYLETILIDTLIKNYEQF